MRCLVAGAGGFIGGHLVRSLLDRGNKVVGCDIKRPADWWQLHDEAQNYTCDARRISCEGIDEVYNLACDMGGMGFIADHRLDCMDSVTINHTLIKEARIRRVKKYFYASSACVYPDLPGKLSEDMAFPAMPEPGYGWEKLFSELYTVEHYKAHPEMQCYVARFHNVYGPMGSWNDGREKAPAALMRKALMSHEIEVWGDGTAKRSFLYIADCIREIHRLMSSDFIGQPVNIGSERLISVTELAKLCGAKKIRYVAAGAKEGVKSRCSDNSFFGCKEEWTLEEGLEKVRDFIAKRI